MNKLMTVSAFSILLALAGCEKEVDDHAATPHGHGDETTVDAHAAAAADQHGDTAGHAEPAGHGAMAPAPMEAAGRDNMGTVVEFSNVPGYTYALVSTHDGNIWLAGPSAELHEGDMVYWNDGAMMTNFSSRAMGKTFESIVFIDKYMDSAAPMAVSAGHGGTMTPAAGGHDKRGKVLSAQVSAGYLYVEVETDEGNIWIASPEQEMHAGDMITWSDASKMSNFTSKSLGRTFDAIYFASGVRKI